MPNNKQLTPGTPREIALCRMACDVMIDAIELRTAGYILPQRLRAIKDELYPAPAPKLVPNVLVLGTNRWTWDGNCWRREIHPNVQYIAPFNGDGASMTADELEAAAAVMRTPMVEEA